MIEYISTVRLYECKHVMIRAPYVGAHVLWVSLVLDDDELEMMFVGIKL